MDERRAFLKALAQRSADTWAAASPEASLRGETRIETRNTIYQLRDGVCVGITRREGNGWRADPTIFIGMRVVGWLAYENPKAGITPTWRPGSYAVLWRARRAKDVHSSVALTSASLAFEKAESGRKSMPPPLPPRASTPPPPPPAHANATMRAFPPPPAALRAASLQRPATPGAIRPLPPQASVSTPRPAPARPLARATA